MEVNFFDDRLEEFIRELEKPTIAKILRTIDLLEHFGHQLGMPHSKKIDHSLFELRIRGQQEVRLIYVFHNNAVMILHGFLKKSQKIPQKEIIIAQQKFTTLDRI
jgi:phage-related protein